MAHACAFCAYGVYPDDLGRGVTDGFAGQARGVQNSTAPARAPLLPPAGVGLFSLSPLHFCRAANWLAVGPAPGSREDGVSSLAAMKRVRPEAVRKVLAVLVFTLPLLFHSPSLKITSAFCSSVVISNMIRHATLPSRPLLAPRPPATRSFLFVQYLHVPLICILLDKARTKVLNFRSLFSGACALFHFPYPVSPVFATLTKSAGCVPTIPKLELVTSLPRAQPRGRLSLGTGFKLPPFILLRTLLRASKCQRLCFQARPHSLRKTWGVGGGGYFSMGFSLTSELEILTSWI